MKKIIGMMLLVAAGFFTQAQTTATPAPAPSKDETEVAAAVEKLRLAMISGNKADLESVLSKDLSYGHSGGKLEDKDSFVTAISTKKSDFKAIELSKQTIAVIGKVAIVRHDLVADTFDKGVAAHIHLGIVLVFQKEKSEWKMIGRRAFHLD
ncbi:MAG: nuclear transport factor 2 family protein [Pedobacter sp.]|nr:MAG: nuclear transport factor 2 family protein [Pedobacter sp.]